MAYDARSERRAHAVKTAPSIDAAVVEAMLADAWSLRPVDEWTFVAVEIIFVIAAECPLLTPDEAFAVAASFLAHLVDKGDFRVDSIQKAGQIQSRFIAYVRHRYGIEDVRRIGRNEVLAFVNAPTLGKESHAPAERTKDNRRWALALLFRTLRSLNLYDGDPLLDVAPFARPDNPSRPLLEWEMRRCQRFSRSSRLHDTLGPVRLALAEATGTASEISRVIAADVHADGRKVWFWGGRTKARWGYLSGWGALALDARLRAVSNSEPEAPITYDGVLRKPLSGASCVGLGLRRILNNASLGDDPRVRPTSIRGLAGRRIWDETGDLDEVRHRLGLAGLDDTLAFIEAPIGRSDIPPSHRAPSRAASP